MKQKDILAFTVGSMVGVIGGLLLAPTSGRTLLENLISRFRNQEPIDELENRTLYNLSELTEDASVLEKLKLQMTE